MLPNTLNSSTKFCSNNYWQYCYLIHGLAAPVLPDNVFAFTSVHAEDDGKGTLPELSPQESGHAVMWMTKDTLSWTAWGYWLSPLAKSPNISTYHSKLSNRNDLSCNINEVIHFKHLDSKLRTFWMMSKCTLCLLHFPSQMLVFVKNSRAKPRSFLATLLEAGGLCNHLPEYKWASVVLPSWDMRKGFCSSWHNTGMKALSAHCLCLFFWPVLLSLHWKHRLNTTMIFLCLRHQIKEKELTVLY